MARRCLVVTYYFPPLGGGGVQRIVKFIKYASRLDWQFTVITADEQNTNIPNDTTLLEEIPDRCKILRLPGSVPGSGMIPFTKHIGYWKRWLSAFKYIPDSRRSWLVPAHKAVINELSRQTYDCLLISIPPYSLAMLAADLTQSQNIPVILDMRDPWTANPYKIHPTPYHFRKDLEIERNAIGRIQFGIAAYQFIPDDYQKQIKAFQTKNWKVIPNGWDQDDFSNLKPERQPEEGFHIAFSGTFYSHINKPHFLFKAMAYLLKHRPEQGKQIHFYHVGKANFALQKVAGKFGLEKQVHLLGYRSHAETLNILSGMDALCFILDDREKRSRNTIGGKVYEYLRLKKPILALVPQEGEAAELIRSTNSGVVIAARKTREIAEQLANWQKDRPHLHFKSIDHYSRGFLAEEWVRFLERVTSSQHKG